MGMNSPVGRHFYRVEDDGRLVLEDANPAADEILGIAHAPLLGLDILDAFPQLAGTEVPDRYREAAARGATWQTEQIFYQDERISGAFMVRAFQTRPGHMVAEFVDITARKQAELELKESEERFRALHNASFGGIGIHEKGVILDCNQGLADITGYSQEELVGMNGLNLIAPEWRDHVMEKIVSGYDKSYEVRGLRKDGSTYPLEIHGKNIPYHGRTVRVTEFRDITERHHAENVLRESEQRFRQVFDLSAVGAVMVGLDDRFLRCNRAFCSFLGYAEDELIGMQFQDVTYPEDREKGIPELKALVAGDVESSHLQNRYVCKDGSVVWGDITIRIMRDTQGAPAYFLPVIQDITASKQAEEEQQRLRDQLLQVQKMESVGQLAGGIAHDFNNMLVPIIGYAELLGDNLPPDDPRCLYVEQIVTSAERSRDLVRQLLAFARKQTLEMKPLNLNRTVENFQKMLRRALHENVTIQTGLSQDIGSIMADVGQVEQIILNLAVNAQDAMPGGGTLFISTSEVVLDEAYTRLHEDLKPGPYVLMSISDTGTGMDKETIPRIFDPFYTTKGPGKGTGLGLATVYGIVKQHGGHVSVHSEPGMGTTFKVYFLPRHGRTACTDYHQSGSGQTRAGQRDDPGVEDNDSVRELIASTLKGYGYTILSAPDGDAALRIAESCPKELALLITDVVLPSMNGKVLYESLCSRYPSIRVLYMSGYTADVITHHGVLDSGVAFMQKPFSLLALAVKVRELLDGR
jgi:PAS domain S-box-containing protein